MPRLLSDTLSCRLQEDLPCPALGQIKLRGAFAPSSFEEKTGPELEDACAKERQKEQDIEDESKEASADVLAYSAREHAIHEAWKHAERANELSKESAEAALEAANESMEARRILDQHDIIAIESQTQDSHC
ncbi:PRX [Symbiodinium sp. CCMP2592]|nr:PRX [Symbiodinium sp. CCMP2592]